MQDHYRRQVRVTRQQFSVGEVVDWEDRDRLRRRMRGVTGRGGALSGMLPRGRTLPDTLIPTRVNLSMRLGSGPPSAFPEPTGHGSPWRSCPCACVSATFQLASIWEMVHCLRSLAPMHCAGLKATRSCDSMNVGTFGSVCLCLEHP